LLTLLVLKFDRINQVFNSLPAMSFITSETDAAQTPKRLSSPNGRTSGELTKIALVPRDNDCFHPVSYSCDHRIRRALNKYVSDADDFMTPFCKEIGN
jgi:hypothetical protein